MLLVSGPASPEVLCLHERDSPEDSDWWPGNPGCLWPGSQNIAGAGAGAGNIGGVQS